MVLYHYARTDSKAHWSVALKIPSRALLVHGSWQFCRWPCSRPPAEGLCYYITHHGQQFCHFVFEFLQDSWVDVIQSWWLDVCKYILCIYFKSIYFFLPYLLQRMHLNWKSDSFYCKKQLKEFIELPSSAAAPSTPWPLCGPTNPQLASCFWCIYRILFYQLQHSLQGSLQILFSFLNFLFEIDLPFLWAYLFSFEQAFHFLKAFLFLLMDYIIFTLSHAGDFWIALGFFWFVAQFLPRPLTQ